jgi:IS605 OrfB family transposase
VHCSLGPAIRTCAPSRTLVLAGHGANIRVERDALVVTEGHTDIPQTPLTHTLFRGVHNVDRITCLKPSGMLSFPAVQWCAEQDITVTLLDRAGSVLATLTPEAKVDILLRRQQYLASTTGQDVTSYLHTASRAIIDLLVREGMGTLVIGKNDGWKQEANRGKKNNQSFIFIPHARFIELLQYKAALVGIQVITIEESHTSKCSFLDLEPIGHQDHYVGKRVKRGLFAAGTGQLINADINGSYNILRRYAPQEFADGVTSFLLRPIPLRLPDRRQDKSKQRPRREARA